MLVDLLRAERFPANDWRINEGQLPRFGREIEDCFFLPAADSASAARLVVDLVNRRLPPAPGQGASPWCWSSHSLRFVC